MNSILKSQTVSFMNCSVHLNRKILVMHTCQVSHFKASNHALELTPIILTPT